MIRLTWRQFRGAALLTFAGLALLGIALGLTGAGLADDYADGLAAAGGNCNSPFSSCNDFIQNFAQDNQYGFLGTMLLLLLLPALIGLFWGAPLITRELESRTLWLIWNQSITRKRWLTVKLVVVGLASMLAAGAAAAIVNWWATPVDKASALDWPRMAPLLFPTRGIVVIGYAAFAFALGVTIGMLVKKTLPAMAITLLIFAAVQVAMPILVRPNLATPVTETLTYTSDNLDDVSLSGDGTIHLSAKLPETGSWILSNQTVDSAGNPAGEFITLPADIMAGPCSREKTMEECVAAVSALGYKQELVYQPIGRFWPFQWAELGIYLGLAAGLSGFCFWWVRKRIV
ncbi:ABC transporter permease subunit [Phytomonospora endophytica]|uniref:ABC-type transport system involved in multi-copper enzyme maturation permease subunit n=1 Tax=Phytomonospora endophytica TaxID=714109 RepID=A0A841FJY0_9ACTN|nr:ABC transporter permease subunit [Phytomonospora endophytica]MBB6037631.1 ABC-type transport system involved in multi-copper enzyme maturation permease subunit [Phytomonospora endophytica]GIG67842.1 transporter [Phytomonospora endophytica]